MSFPTEIIASVAVFLCLAIGIVVFVVQYQRRVINHQVQIRELNQRQQIELMQASIQSEERERLRIAAELHDDVGATLSSIRLFLHQVAKQPGNKALVDQTRGLLDMSIQKVRDISHQLQPGTLAYVGLFKALESLAEMMTRTGAVRMEITSLDTWTDPADDVSLSLYRIMQELVNNITKHAGADRIWVQAAGNSMQCFLNISHNGNGLTEIDYQAHLRKEGASGLKNIESRLRSSGISIRFEKAAENDCRIQLSAPKHITG